MCAVSWNKHMLFSFTVIQVIFTIWKINPKVSDYEQILIYINNAGVIETTGIRNGRK